MLTGAAGGSVALLLSALGLLLIPLPGVRRRVPRGVTFSPRLRPWLVGASGAAGLCVLIGLPPWVTAPAAAVGGAAGAAVARRALARTIRGDPRRVASVCDLLAACLDAGIGMDRAIPAVLAAESAATPSGPTAGGSAGRAAASSAGQLGSLAEVAALLALGAPPDVAWRPAAEQPDLAPLAMAAQRSAIGGARIADAVRESADELRARGRSADEKSAARAGVAMVAPLALCFLPAFACLGLAPVVIGLLGSLHIFG